MIREIFRNITGRKRAVPYPEGFRISTEEAASVIPLAEKINKVFGRSLRAKRGNLAFNKINGLEIASSQKLLLAMTCDGFFNSLSKADPISTIWLNAVLL
ncbi:MAG: hypothetical protein A2Z47_01425 [Thermodesulfovibrio sp. RBG_19FT_COMBO_42_12]|nr:MAG: hypothetical protein A2Z47_01425 [Thermodesulfovibrio sp. RBG_19FT_COMBO_42_12]